MHTIQTTTTILTYIVIGCITGLSMGSIGIGAGLISMPLLISTGLTVKESIAIAMVMQLFPQSIPGVINYRYHIRWIPSIAVILGSAIGIYIGSFLVTKQIITEQTIYRIITIFLALSSAYFYIHHW